MKKLTILLFTLFLLNITIKSQVFNNFENGNWLYYYNLCWGIGVNDKNYNTKVTGNGFNSTNICETNNLSINNTAHLISPWIKINNNSKISFDHALFKYAENVKLTLYIDNFLRQPTEAYTHIYTNTNQISTSIIFNLPTGTYKFIWKWEYYGENTVIGQIDNINIDGVYYSDPTNHCNQIVEPPIDSDNDGVLDINDEYPTDSLRAYNIYYPTNDIGTLVFEDIYPYYGDYDFNDIVIGFKFKVVTNGNNNIVEMFSTFILKANGGSYNNGFGFELPNLTNNQILESNGFGVNNTIPLNPNNTELKNTKASFILFDNSHYYNIKNTTKGIYTNYVYFNIYIKFQNNININTLNIYNFNPFIFVNQNRAHEVHLPNYKPTELFDYSLFGTGDDDSNTTTNKYFKSKTNLPWALKFDANFKYPTEKTDILIPYTKFKNWVETNGNEYNDWWYNQNYIDNDKLY